MSQPVTSDVGSQITAGINPSRWATNLDYNIVAARMRNYDPRLTTPKRVNEALAEVTTRLHIHGSHSIVSQPTSNDSDAKAEDEQLAFGGTDFVLAQLGAGMQLNDHNITVSQSTATDVDGHIKDRRQSASRGDFDRARFAARTKVHDYRGPLAKLLDPFEQFRNDWHPIFRTYMPEFVRLNEMNATFEERVAIFNNRALATKRAVKAHKLPPLMKSGFVKFEQRRMESDAVVAAWQDYFGEDVEDNWVRLCRDLHVRGELKTRADCAKVLRTLWVNICDFLQNREEVCFFASEQELSVYSIATGKIYPRRQIPNGSALEYLVIKMFDPKKQPVELKDENGKTVEVIGHVAACKTWRLGEKSWNIQRHLSKEEIQATRQRKVSQRENGTRF